VAGGGQNKHKGGCEIVGDLNGLDFRNNRIFLYARRRVSMHLLVLGICLLISGEIKWI